MILFFILLFSFCVTAQEPITIITQSPSLEEIPEIFQVNVSKQFLNGQTKVAIASLQEDNQDIHNQNTSEHSDADTENFNKACIKTVDSVIRLRFKNFRNLKKIDALGTEFTTYKRLVSFFNYRFTKYSACCIKKGCNFFGINATNLADHYIQKHYCSTIFSCINLGCYTICDSRKSLIEHVRNCPQTTL
ncbi:MAG: hypothetical protein ACOYT8_05915 [Candidatus Dependentiae bacterium]